VVGEKIINVTRKDLVTLKAEKNNLRQATFQHSQECWNVVGFGLEGFWQKSRIAK